MLPVLAAPRMRSAALPCCPRLHLGMYCLPPPTSLPAVAQDKAAAPKDAAPKGADAPKDAPAPQAPPCECPLPPDGGGYFGQGKFYVSLGCTCENA